MRRKGRIWRIILFRAKSDPALEVQGRLLPIMVRRHQQSRGYRLRYDALAGALRLTMPMRGAERDAIAWARTQHGWVATQMARQPQVRRLAPDESFPFEGIDRRILWDRAYPRLPQLTDDSLILGGLEESVGARVLRWLRAHALEVLTTETHEFAAREGLVVSSVRVADPRSRWGSCAHDGSIRYSWRLIFAPSFVRRATVAHEVAHLLHMDHSPAFHRAHARLLGEDPAPARQWLRAHGATLHHFTA